MAVLEKSVLVGHSAMQMFELVDQVEAYPLFLPWCQHTEVLERDKAKTVATLFVDYHHLRTRFTTENDKQAPTLITMALREGPFKSLAGHWCFTPLAERACKVEFRLAYEFSNRLLAVSMGPLFNHVTQHFVEAFVKRAAKIYSSS